MSKEPYNVQRVHLNLQALAELEKNNPNPDVLKRYTGWGGLRSAIFNPEIYRDLKKFASDKDILSIKKSVTNAYYTPCTLIQFIYDALALMKKTFKTILEPSAGHGLFFELMPQALKGGTSLYAVEMDEISCRLIRALYPDVQLHQGGFENCHPKIQFDLIIGNPPYGREMLVDERHADLANLRIHHYFVAKCMRLLAPGGVLAMVLPRYFLDNRRDHARDIIHKEGGSLLAAYRLPDNLFMDAKVTVDVVFLIKEARDTDWICFDKQRIDNETVFINRYFAANPAHVIGELGVIEAYGRPELTCRSNGKSDTIGSLREHLAWFPPQKLQSIDECKAQLAKRMSLLDKQMQSLARMKNQLTQAQRDLQLMERRFLKDCADKINLNNLLNQAP